MNINIKFIQILFIIFFVTQLGAQEKVKPNLSFSGLIQYNMEFHQIGESSYAGQEFRRMVLTGAGNITNDISYVAQLDFAEGTAGLNDVYIKFSNIPLVGGAFKVGSAVEPTGLEQLTGINYKTFSEGAIMTTTQGFRWNTGFFYENFNLFNNKVGIQLSYTFNGDRTAGFIDQSVNKGGNFIVRLSSAVIQNKEQKSLLHLGTHYENRNRPDEKYVQKFRPDVHMGDIYSFVVPNINTQNDYGFELAASYKQFSIQSEYELSTFDKAEETYSLRGYYAFVSFFPTGDHRNYNNGVFGMLVPKKNFNFKEGGWGALELAFRYEQMDYSDAGNFLPMYKNLSINGKTIESMTFGFNWYLNSHSKIIYNYVWSDTKLSDNFKANTLKFQVMF